MKVSIVINNYNYERFVAESIESALAQDYDDLEIVIVDDGSTDGSRAIIESFDDPRVVKVLTENQGQGAAVSTGFAHATGEVIMLLDSDDTIWPDAARTAAREFAADPSLSKVQWPMQIVDAENQPSGPIVPRVDMMVSGNLTAHLLRYRTYVWPATSGNAYSAKALRQLLPAPAHFRLAIDLYLAETTPLLGNIKSLPTPHSNYRVHGSNNWIRNHGDVDHIHKLISYTVQDHEHVKAVGAKQGIDVPAEATAALDVAFVQQRLASLRMEPATHPIAGDTLLRLTIRGIAAAVAHPHHDTAHKAKRVAWILIVAIAPKKLAIKAINRFYFRPNG